MASFVTGATFGAAIVSSNLQSPSLGMNMLLPSKTYDVDSENAQKLIAWRSKVISQLKLLDWRVAQILGTATASSAIIYQIGSYLGYVKLQPRSSSPLGIFGKYGGNIVGGAVLGIGIAMCGAGPETAIAQAAVGLQAGLSALVGATLGGLLWTGGLSSIILRYNERHGATSEMATINEPLGVSSGTMSLVLGSASLALVYRSVALTDTPSPTLGRTSSLVAGLLIASSQVVSLVIRKTMIGISGAYEEVGNHWWYLFGRNRPSSSQNIAFAVGIAMGAWIALGSGLVSATDSPLLYIPRFPFLGGMLMVVGSRLAGGCTCGHGISGLSLLSSASLVTTISTFLAGHLAAYMLY